MGSSVKGSLMFEYTTQGRQWYTAFCGSRATAQIVDEKLKTIQKLQSNKAVCNHTAFGFL